MTDPRRYRVLVVDDERDVVMTLGILFRSEGFDVQVVRGGKDVPEAVKRFQPDVVLLDLRMPDRNGYAVAQDLRSTYGRQHPILVAVTARVGDVDKRLAEISGFDHYVTKPYDPQALLSLVASMVGRQQKAQPALPSPGS